jgi:hypothetical protein
MRRRSALAAVSLSPRRVRQAGAASRKIEALTVTIRFGTDLSGPTDVQTTNEGMEVGMSFSVYDITVPIMVHGLNVMDDYLDHAQRSSGPRGLTLGGSLLSGSRPP